MTLIVRASDNPGTRGPSPDLWQGQEPMTGEWWKDPNRGWGIFDDFLTFNATANGYTIETSDDKQTWAPLATIVPTTAVQAGVLRSAITGDANEQGSINYGVATTVIGSINEGTGACAFEVRWRTSLITDGVNAIAIGLAEENMAGAADLITDAGVALADKDFIGFVVLATDDNDIRFMHSTNGGAWVNVGSAGALVADTWIKTGLYFDGIDKVSYFLDGVYVGHIHTSATNFPDGEEFTFLVSHKSVDGTAVTLDIDWWAFAQEAV